MRSTIFLLTLLLFTVSLANWNTTPIQIHAGSAFESSLIVPTNNRSLTLVFYSSAGRICWKRFGFSDALLATKCIPQPRQVLNVSAAVDHTGRSMFVVYSAARSFVQGNIDLYFTESADFGETWSLPVPLPRERLDDQANRWGQQLVRIPAGKRLFVAFLKKSEEDARVQLCYVTRPDGSAVFANEVRIDYWMRVDSISLAYTLQSETRADLHIFAYYNDHDLVHYKSSTLGAQWEKFDLVDAKHELFYAITVSPDRRTVYCTAHYDGTELDIFWLTVGSTWGMSVTRFSPAASGCGNAAAGIRSRSGKDLLVVAGCFGGSAKTAIFDPESKALSFRNEAAPEKSYGGAATSECEGEIKARVLHRCKGATCMSSYLVTEKVMQD